VAAINPGVTRVEHTDAFVVGGNHLVRNPIEGRQSARRENTAAAPNMR
jgi:hypothetical protein